MSNNACVERTTSTARIGRIESPTANAKYSNLALENAAEP